MKKVSKRIIVTIVSVCIAYFIVIILFGHLESVKHADICVVLGNKVNPDSSLSPRLKARLDRCISLYKDGLFSTVIVSGGIGKEGVNEATAMKLYLTANNLPPDSIITDSSGINTYMTAQFTKTYMTQQNLRSVLVVSQYFHLLRTKMILQRIGVNPVYYAYAHFYEIRDIYSILREMAGIITYQFR
jgi:vancomycin permeability regulator SanA